MRNMSFMLTTKQFLDGSKDVTRRLGWKFLKAGDRVMAVEKGQGLKKGEKVNRLGEIEIVSIRSERLWDITDEDVGREGYPGKSHYWFVAHFLTAMKCNLTDEVTRIEFKRIEEPPS